MKYSVLALLFVLVVSMSCKQDPLPKPKAFLRLQFPQADYNEWSGGCEYTFDKNNVASVRDSKDCSMVIDYPMMKGSIYLTYKKIDGNLKDLLVDAEKLTYEHVSKADIIDPKIYINEQDKVYGMFHEVIGNAASQSQFYVTDSLNHFVTGSLYFYAKPNYDSIYPAAIYLQKDIRRIMESLKWE